MYIAWKSLAPIFYWVGFRNICFFTVSKGLSSCKSLTSMAQEKTLPTFGTHRTQSSSSHRFVDENGFIKRANFKGVNKNTGKQLPPLLLLLLPPANQMSNNWNLDNAHTHTINRLNPATQLRLVVDLVQEFQVPFCSSLRSPLLRSRFSRLVDLAAVFQSIKITEKINWSTTLGVEATLGSWHLETIVNHMGSFEGLFQFWWKWKMILQQQIQFGPMHPEHFISGIQLISGGGLVTVLVGFHKYYPSIIPYPSSNRT